MAETSTPGGGEAREARGEGVWFLVLTVPFVLLAVGLVLASGPLAPLEAVGWYDPVFFQYNVLLLTAAVLFVPTIVWRYVRTMAEEKEWRLQRELARSRHPGLSAELRERIRQTFRFRRYLGSVAALMLVVLLGGAAILLLKPAFGEGPGLDYGRGANLLMLGPFALEAPEPEAYRNQLAVSLTAFTFGFLGGYVYFLTHLMRSYFTLDLSPSTFVESSVRMITASLLALVLGFALPVIAGVDLADSEAGLGALHLLPVLAFFLGYFPSRALLLIEKTASAALGLALPGYRSASLGELSGMSFAHEVRLVREGYDNLENLARADALDLALRTGIGYHQLEDWIGQAWLRERLGAEAYARFQAATGLLGRGDLEAYLAAADDGEAAIEELARSLGDEAERLRILCRLLAAPPSLPRAA